jgi:Zn-dependent metalloprotease
MYKDWYNMEPVVDYLTKQPLKIIMFTHACHFMNAMWTIDHMVLCDGDDGAYNTDSASYPVTSLDVIAHEISHGFTFNHSMLRYDEQSGGINESFSDMAAQAISYYVNGRADWLIGATLFKNNDRALRYINNPTQDCKNGDQPGITCSIDHVKDYTDKTDVHHSSGVFNKAFYLMSTASNWNVRKAFNIMVHANRYYWTYDATFASAACGVVDATKDYEYDTNTVSQAFLTVGIDTSKC